MIFGYWIYSVPHLVVLQQTGVMVVSQREYVPRHKNLYFAYIIRFGLFISSCRVTVLVVNIPIIGLSASLWVDGLFNLSINLITIRFISPDSPAQQGRCLGTEM
ncbi:MAG: hypothetical protein J07HQW1_01923 [Haloquadratum walsbyi J07HQW1]|uniref:Uncharacterized protein n=1 Tax=Haloquadratum walsbyi J07HQW1 TaxID=1238424 RepID=U1MPM6_9EURY|nr:MAG: hypothetical protein J07HQW1_01923 [Haloquadratum walsbyi J07HQW1]